MFIIIILESLFLSTGIDHINAKKPNKKGHSQSKGISNTRDTNSINKTNSNDDTDDTSVTNGRSITKGSFLGYKRVNYI